MFVLLLVFVLLFVLDLVVLLHVDVDLELRLAPPGPCPELGLRAGTAHLKATCIDS